MLCLVGRCAEKGQQQGQVQDSHTPALEQPATRPMCITLHTSHMRETQKEAETDT